MIFQRHLRLGTAFLMLASGAVLAQSQSAAKLPSDLDPDSRARLPYLQRKDMDEKNQKIFDTLPGRSKEGVLGGPLAFAAYNPGVAFSTFASAAGHTGMRVILAAIALIALVGISLLALRAAPDQSWRRTAYALIAGGALGNLVDRVRDGAVTDFVRWRIHDHRWPIFNVADAVLVVGVAVLLLDGLRARRAALRRTE